MAMRLPFGSGRSTPLSLPDAPTDAATLIRCAEHLAELADYCHPNGPSAAAARADKADLLAAQRLRRRVDGALRDLRRMVDGVPTPDDIRALRRKLKLTQRDAGEVFKVGANAFDKYERGLVAPSGPTVQLMLLLILGDVSVKGPDFSRNLFFVT